MDTVEEIVGLVVETVQYSDYDIAIDALYIHDQYIPAHIEQHTTRTVLSVRPITQQELNDICI